MKHRPKPPAELVAKMHPRRFSGCSPKWCAIVGYILGQKWTDPSIAELIVTSDGGVLARHTGDVGANDFIGAQEDLWNNWRRYLTAAGLDAKEKKQAQRLFDSAVTKWGDKRWVRENPSHRRKCGCIPGERACDIHRGGGIIRAHRQPMRRHFHVKKVDGGFRVIAPRKNPDLGMPGMPHTWVTKEGTHVRGGDLVEFWDMGAYHRGDKKKRVARVNRLLVFDDHVIVGGGMGEYVDDDNFIRVVSKRREV